MRRLLLLLTVSILLISCVAPTPTLRSYATVLFVEYSEAKRLDRLNIELFLDDGRVFTAMRYKTNTPFTTGDRVLVEYKNVEVKKIHLIETMPKEDIWDAR